MITDDARNIYRDRSQMSDTSQNDRDGSKHGEDADHLSIETRLTLVRQSIIETAINHSADRITIFRLINRVIFAFNGPIVFAFIQRLDRHYELVFESTYDPLNTDAFYAALHRIGFRGGSINVRSAEPIKSSFVQIFDTDYYLLPLTTSYTNGRTPFRQSELIFKVLPPQSTAHQFLSRAFKPFGPSLASLKLGRDFKKHLAELVDRSAPTRAKYDDPNRKNKAPANLASALSSSVQTANGRPLSAIDKLDDMVLSEILRIADSPLLSIPQAKAPNLMVFSKRFSRQSRRFNRYFYDSHPVLPADLVQRYVDHLHDIGYEGIIPFPDDDDSTDAWFKDAIRRRAVIEISAIATSPLSTGLRLCVDFVMRTGTGLVYYNPFKDGYIGWIEEDLPEEERKQEKKRLAILHYFLQAGDPGTKNPYLLLLPIRVSGAVYMVSVSVVDGDKCEAFSDDVEAEADAPLVSSEEFQYRTFLYHSILRHFEDRIRRRSKETYLESVADIISDVVLTSAARHQPARRLLADLLSDHGPQLTPQDYASLRNRLMMLCRIYPYDPIDIRTFLDGQLRAIEAADINGIALRRLRIAGDAQEVHFALLEGSPFYDRVQLHDFLDPDSTQRRLEDMINARFGAWINYEDEGRHG